MHDIDEAVYLADEIVVMGDGFEGSREVIPVPLPRPGDRGKPQLLDIRVTLLRRFKLVSRETIRVEGQLLLSPLRSAMANDGGGDQALSLALEAECLLIRKGNLHRWAGPTAETRHFLDRLWDGSPSMFDSSIASLRCCSHEQARSV
jgi:hypothetical protein